MESASIPFWKKHTDSLLAGQRLSAAGGRGHVGLIPRCTNKVIRLGRVTIHKARLIVRSMIFLGGGFFCAAHRRQCKMFLSSSPMCSSVESARRKAGQSGDAASCVRATGGIGTGSGSSVDGADSNPGPTRGESKKGEETGERTLGLRGVMKVW